MERAQHNLRFTELARARAYAQAHGLRQKAVCHIVRRGTELLVFDHVPDGGAGVQVVAGGLEAGETPEQAALREAGEETGQDGFQVVGFLGSAVWLNTEHAKRELRHFVHLTAPTTCPTPGSTAPTGICFPSAGSRCIRHGWTGRWTRFCPSWGEGASRPTQLSTYLRPFDF
ncbi:NUDIX domain-containing protein [Deinococcus radiodurans]|nr:NUDIX domain-containing protein [Deinococcus radiodurans]